MKLEQQIEMRPGEVREQGQTVWALNRGETKGGFMLGTDLIRFVFCKDFLSTVWRKD